MGQKKNICSCILRFKFRCRLRLRFIVYCWVMHHFTSKVSIEKFQGDERASLIHKYALIDKTPIFSAFDISTTCRYFKVLLFIVDNYREVLRRKGGWQRFFSLRKPIFFTLYIFRARIIIRQDLKQWLDNFHLRQRAGTLINRVRRHVLPRAEKCESIFQDEKTGKRSRCKTYDDDSGISNRVCSRWPLQSGKY